MMYVVKYDGWANVASAEAFIDVPGMNKLKKICQMLNKKFRQNIIVSFL